MYQRSNCKQWICCSWGELSQLHSFNETQVREVSCIKYWMTYSATRSPLGILDVLLFGMSDGVLAFPQQRLGKNDKLSWILVMVSFHSAVLGLVVGRTSPAPIILNLVKACSSRVGMHQMRALRGIKTKPRASKIPHSWLVMWVIWKAAPLMNTMRTWPATSTSHN